MLSTIEEVPEDVSHTLPLDDKTSLPLFFDSINYEYWEQGEVKSADLPKDDTVQEIRQFFLEEFQHSWHTIRRGVGSLMDAGPLRLEPYFLKRLLWVWDQWCLGLEEWEHYPYQIEKDIRHYRHYLMLLERVSDRAGQGTVLALDELNELGLKYPCLERYRSVKDSRTQSEQIQRNAEEGCSGFGADHHENSYDDDNDHYFDTQAYVSLDDQDSGYGSGK